MAEDCKKGRRKRWSPIIYANSILTANFDRLSLRINRELNVASSAPEISQQLLERLFEPDFRISPELTEPIPERWVDHLVEIIGDYVY